VTPLFYHLDLAIIGDAFTYVTGQNDLVLSRPGCHDWVFGLTFSLLDCQLFFLDQ